MYFLLPGMLFDLGFTIPDDRQEQIKRYPAASRSLHQSKEKMNQGNGERTDHLIDDKGESREAGESRNSKVDQPQDLRRKGSSKDEANASRRKRFFPAINLLPAVIVNDRSSSLKTLENHGDVNRAVSNQNEESQKIHDVDGAIRSMEKDFDLVLLTEYFDESLILMKREFCWSFNDLVYFKQNVRARRKPISPKNAQRIQNWNSGDLELYRYFNRTLWTKIEKYGRVEFQNDLKEFRRLNKEIVEQCSFKKQQQKVYLLSQLTSDIKSYVVGKDNGVAESTIGGNSLGGVTSRGKDNVKARYGISLDGKNDVKDRDDNSLANVPSLNEVCERMLIPEAEYILRFRHKYGLNPTLTDEDD